MFTLYVILLDRFNVNGCEVIDHITDTTNLVLLYVSGDQGYIKHSSADCRLNY